MRRRLLASGGLFIDRDTDILFKSKMFTPNLTGLMLTGEDIVIKEDVSGNVLWSCVGSGSIEPSATLTPSNIDIDIRITAKKLDRIRLIGCVQELKKFRINQSCDVTLCFYGNSYLTSVTDTLLDNIINCDEFFSQCNNLTHVEPFSIKQNANLSNLFYSCTSLSTIPILNIEDAGKLYKCFYNTNISDISSLYNKSFKAVDVNNFLDKTKISELRDISFPYVTSFFLEHLPNLVTVNNLQFGKSSTFSVTNCPLLQSVTNIQSSSITSLKLSYNTSLVEVLNIGTHTSGLTDCSNAFYGCTSLTIAPALNYSSLTIAGSMFEGCYSLTNITNLGNNVSPQYCGAMFKNCVGLTSLGTFNTNSIVNSSEMYKGCSGLTGSISISLGSVLTLTKMFELCTNITQASISSGYVNSSDCTDVFYGCTSLVSASILYNSSPYNADISYDRAFYGCSSLSTCTLSEHITSGSYVSTFEGCTSLAEYPSTLPSTGKNYTRAFYGCTSLLTLSDKSYVVTVPSTYSNQLAELIEMFAYSGLTSISNITYSCSVKNDTLGYVKDYFKIGALFKGCQNLSSVSSFYISLPYDVSQINPYIISDMFAECSLLDSPVQLSMGISQRPGRIRSEGLMNSIGKTTYNNDLYLPVVDSFVEFVNNNTLNSITIDMSTTRQDKTIEIAGFSNCANLQRISITNNNNYILKNAKTRTLYNTYSTDFLVNLPSLTELYIKGLAQSVSIPTGITNTAMLEDILNNLADNTGASTPLYFEIGSSRLSQISQAVKDSATAKNWVLQ